MWGRMLGQGLVRGRQKPCSGMEWIHRHVQDFLAAAERQPEPRTCPPPALLYSSTDTWTSMPLQLSEPRNAAKGVLQATLRPVDSQPHPLQPALLGLLVHRAPGARLLGMPCCPGRAGLQPAMPQLLPGQPRVWPAWDCVPDTASLPLSQLHAAAAIYGSSSPAYQCLRCILARVRSSSGIRAPAPLTLATSPGHRLVPGRR